VRNRAGTHRRWAPITMGTRQMGLFQQPVIHSVINKCAYYSTEHNLTNSGLLRAQWANWVSTAVDTNASSGK